jgi:DNA polymerase-3 subunit delta'
MSWNDLKDQRAAAVQFHTSLKRGRLAHAYLLVGRRGSGKQALARTLAKALNCLEKQHDSCDRCDACRRIDGDIHPDVHWVRPESRSRRITVGQMRELENELCLKAGRGRIKVGVVADADCMGEEAANAFLKTLEEPPGRTVILLLSAEPQRLLPTIRSRCLSVALGPVGRAATEQRMAVLPLLVKFSAADNSRIVTAYKLLAELTALLQQIREDIHARVESEADIERYDELEPQVRERLEQQVAARIEGEYRAAREQVLEELYAWFADVLLCVEGADAGLLEHGDAIAALRRAAHGLDYERAAANLDAVELIRDSLARNISEPLALEAGLLKLARPSASARC